MNLDLRFAPEASGRWQQWWQSRLKASDTHRLNLHNVYVLPTRAGWMMLVTIAVLMLATINYQLNLGYVLIFLLMGAGIVGLYLAHRAMTRITLSLDTSSALCGIAGEVIEVTIQVNAQGAIRLQTLSTQFDTTGSLPLPIVTSETRYPLGLIRLWSVWRIQTQVDIDSPKAISSSAPPSPDVRPLDPIKDDFRAYRVGDAPRDLLWKTVAKRPDSPSNWGVRERDQATSHTDELETRRYAPLAAANAQAAAPVDWQSLLRKRDQLLLCVLLVIALPFFLHLTLWYPLLATALIVLRLWLTRTHAAQAPKWLQLPLIAGLGLMVWLQFRTFNGIAPSVAACIGLLGIKALELPKPSQQTFSRDRWVLVYLGLFTLAAHFLVSQSLLSSALVVMGLVGLIYVLVDAHSTSISTPWVTRPRIRTTAALVVLGAPIMLVLFFLFPRFAPLWTLTNQKSTAVSGLSNEMRVGDMSQITLDNRIILRLAVDATNPPTQIPSKDIYLRGPVLPRFDGKAWTTYARSTVNSKLPPVELDWEGSSRFDYTIFEEPKRSEGNLRASTEVRTSARIRNDAQSISRPYLQTAWLLPDSSNPRTSQWLRGLQQDSRFAHYTAQDWSKYLLGVFKAAGFRYSLEPGNYGEHHVDELLFDRPADRRLGFCEHYASAFVIAMRRLGIPARVVTGYQGAEINPVDGLLVVRNRNAHAWAEYWDGALGWQRVDPTAVVAPERIENINAFNQAPEQLAKQNGFAALSSHVQWLWTARQTWDATSFAWEQWMQNYNQGAQLNLLKHLGFDNPHWRDLVQLLDVALIALLGLGAVLYTFKGKRRSDAWLVLLQAARDKAMRSGASLPPHASPKDIALQLPPQWPNRSRALAWLMRLERARYRSASSNQTTASELATLKRSFKSDFRAPT
jgi:protein-glutamine gamma-glutamyltransferase